VRLAAAISSSRSRQSKTMDRCHASNSGSSGSRNLPDHIFPDCCSLSIVLSVPLGYSLSNSFQAAVELGHFAAFAEGEEAGRGVGEKLSACVCDVEIAHGELADAVAR